MTLFCIEEVSFHERDVHLRLPFRFGVATLTSCPQVHVLVKVKFSDGSVVEGCSAEMMVPKWFDKNTALSNEDNFEQLRTALRVTRSAYLSDKKNKTAWQHFIDHYDAILGACHAQNINALTASYGPALMDRAVIDAVCHHAGVSFYQCIQANMIGMKPGQHPKLADVAEINFDQFLSGLNPSNSIAARHTVGLIDPLVKQDITPDMPRDGLPVCLADVVQYYGHTHYKLKLSGDANLDIDRLEKINTVIEESAKVITLDGNEQYTSGDQFTQFFEKFKASSKLKSLSQKTIFVEQPIRRDQTMNTPIHDIAKVIPLLIDESDSDLNTFVQATQLGYTGISSKSCKGVYKSVINAARCALLSQQTGISYFQSGEDLTMQAGVAVQQDLVLVSLLGLSHVERNGHHYVNGMAAVSQEEQLQFQKTYPSVYESQNEVVRLHIQQGQIDLRSLNIQGFATGQERAQIDWHSMDRVY